MAQEHKWEELLRYCADDVRILCDLYRRRVLNNPRFHKVIDLRKISSRTLYPESFEAEVKANKQTSRIWELEAELEDLKGKLKFMEEMYVPAD